MRSLRLPRLLMLAGVCAAFGAGCARLEPATEGRGAAPADAQALACAALRGRTSGGWTITHAQWQPPQLPQLPRQAPAADGAAPGGAPTPPRAPAVPAHCLLVAQAAATSTPAAGHVEAIELRVPAAPRGNSLLYEGLDDARATDDADPSDDAAAGSAAAGPPAGSFRPAALARGFTTAARHLPRGAQTASAATAGSEALAWAVHERAAVAGQALHALVAGQAPRRRYVAGCGEGGRQAMLFTQRAPERFDGALAVAPRMHLSADVAALWAARQWRSAPALTPAQWARVAREVIDRCDAADGLADGLVFETALCRIKPQRLTCPGGGEGCLAPAQVDALARALQGPHDGAGRALHVRWPWDGGIGSPDWRAAMIGEAGHAAPLEAQALERIAWRYLVPPDPTLSADAFDFNREPLRLERSAGAWDAGDDVLLRAFQRRGGRLLLLHGMADPVVSALDTMDYQRRAHEAHGERVAARFMRSFFAPAMQHCGGAFAPRAADTLAALVDWVEHERAPDRLPAHGSGAFAGIERPLCPWPKITRHLGGSSDDAARFECR